MGFPLFIGLAIFKYRLYAIDLVINRTVVSGALTFNLALVYFGSVVLLQALFETVTGQSQSPLMIMISTLSIATLFSPLHRRIQKDIDRRFYRHKYDTEKMFGVFDAKLRKELNLDEISQSLLTVTMETMQPARTSFWLAEEPVADMAAKDCRLRLLYI